MHIRVKLFATLKMYAPVEGLSGTPFEMDLPEGFTLQALTEYLKLPPEEVKLTFVNGRAQPLEFELTNGDEVGIFPPVGGG
jgi:molybdopterin synthase sulfur carrier subunit